MSQIANKQIAFLITILQISHAYIVYQLLLIFVSLPPPVFSANVLQRNEQKIPISWRIYLLFLDLPNDPGNN